jgi:hypothetical protein
MQMRLQQVDDAQMRVLRRDPAAALPLIAADISATSGIAGWLRRARLRRVIAAYVRRQARMLRETHAAMAQRGAAALLALPASQDCLDLQSDWRGLHYLLTGTPESGLAPLNLLCVGGEDLGADFGLARVRLVSAAAVHDFARALDKAVFDSLIDRTQRHHRHACGVHGAVGLGSAFERLKGFATQAATRRAGALIWVA